jgi:hypothetical protein
MGLILVLALAVAAPASNLLSNPDFTRGILELEGWSLNAPEGNVAVRMRDRVQPDRHAVRLVGSGRDWAGLTGRRVEVQSGETLTIAAWLSSRATGPLRGNLYVRFFRNNGFAGQTGPEAPADAVAWTLVSGIVTVPEGCTLADFSFQLWSRGEVTITAAGLFRGDVRDQLAGLLPAPPPLNLFEVTPEDLLPVDANRNGLPDSLETYLCVPAGAVSTRRTRRPTTCLQTPTGWRADNDLKVDTILVVNESAQAFRSWQMMGYRTWYMTGFRAGPDYLETHAGSVQQDRSGRLLDCGPGSYYMVPTADRRRVLSERFATAIRNGGQGAGPEEPEFIGSGGYSPAFQQEFEAFYGRPWVAPHESAQARADCQRLMGHLEVELLRACYDGARSVVPNTPKILLCHSPLNYSAWNIVFPHCETLRELGITEMVAQVWTGTARSAVSHAGVRAERTFENAWLEYSSSLNLTRGLGIPTWLLMDPLEDNPDRPMEDYFVNYKATLGAALMFSETDLYEVMPWPTRIFGRVPDDFAAVVGNVIAALGDMQNQPPAIHGRGTEGIATFLSDSAMWLRAEPVRSNMDAVYGLCLPFIMQGVPAAIAHLDRAANPGYLDPYRVLLVSFDALKPVRKADADALLAWTRAGGQLILCGGAGVGDDLHMWWKDEGCISPHAYVLQKAGLDPAGMRLLGTAPVNVAFTVVAQTDYTGHNLENRGPVAVDLTSAVRDTGCALVKFEDTVTEDGWGPYLSAIHLRGTRDGKTLDQRIVPGTPLETALIYSDNGSNATDTARFVDGRGDLVYLLRFDPGTTASAEFDVGNQYRVSVAPAPSEILLHVEVEGAGPLGDNLRELGAAELRKAVGYPSLGGRTLVSAGDVTLLAEAPLGTGSITVCGLDPATFARTGVGDRLVRALARSACGRIGVEYTEPGVMEVQRGPYLVVRTLEQPLEIAEPMVDLFTPDLRVRPAGVLAPGSLAILKRLPPVGPTPVVVASSGCMEWTASADGALCMLISGADSVPGVIRVVTGGRRVEATARDAFGHEREVQVTPEGDTALLRFRSEPLALGLRVAFAD